MLTKMDNSFKENLLALSNQLRKTDGMRESDDIIDAVSLLMTHIVVSVQCKSNHSLIKSYCPEAVCGAVFFLLIGPIIFSNFEHYGIQLPDIEILGRVGKAVFPFLDSGQKVEVIRSGVEQTKAILKEVDTKEHILEYYESISNIVWGYVMSKDAKDERFLEAFRILYMQLYNAWDITYSITPDRF